MDNYDKLFTTIENYQNMTVAYLAVSFSCHWRIGYMELTGFGFTLYSTPRSARVSWGLFR